MEPIASLRAEDLILAAETDEVAVQRVDIGIAVALREVELRCRERLGTPGSGKYSCKSGWAMLRN